MISLSEVIKKSRTKTRNSGSLARTRKSSAFAPDVFKNYLSLAYFLVGRCEDALKLLSSNEGRESVTRLYRILNLVGSNQVEEAKGEALLLLGENPSFSIARAQSFNSFRREVDRTRILGALHAAGLPE